MTVDFERCHKRYIVSSKIVNRTEKTHEQETDANER